MTTLTATSEFAAAVRAALSDLPPDELDELTDGLEADLAERAEESGTDLGDPAEYAAELRAAAGYPPRAARDHVAGIGVTLRDLPKDIRREWKALVARSRVVHEAVDFFVALRPVWWVLRGLVVTALIALLLGGGTNFWPLAVVLVVLSVQLGRGRMPAPPWARWTLRAVSAVAVIAAPFVLAAGVSAWNYSQYQMYEQTYYPPTGLTSNGAQVDNIFAYDAAGEPIEQVQLFDQNGNPLDLTSDTGAQWWDGLDGSMIVPSGDVPGRAGWNVYPLAHVDDWSDYEDDGQIDDSEISPADFPLYKVKPLAGYVAEEATGSISD